MSEEIKTPEKPEVEKPVNVDPIRKEMDELIKQAQSLRKEIEKSEIDKAEELNNDLIALQEKIDKLKAESYPTAKKIMSDIKRLDDIEFETGRIIRDKDTIYVSAGKSYNVTDLQGEDHKCFKWNPVGKYIPPMNEIFNNNRDINGRRYIKVEAFGRRGPGFAYDVAMVFRKSARTWGTETTWKIADTPIVSKKKEKKYNKKKRAYDISTYIFLGTQIKITELLLSDVMPEKVVPSDKKKNKKK